MEVHHRPAPAAIVGQTLDALDYIVDALKSAFAEGYTDEQWPSIANHLGKHVRNGLT
ncbi:MAG TPA: hypothetical protein VK512_04940 [Xanthobacteraceae bacterium]|nr:hypothetical protein [Xanthobacteraceae bacterium]